MYKDREDALVNGMDALQKWDAVTVFRKPTVDQRMMIREGPVIARELYLRRIEQVGVPYHQVVHRRCEGVPIEPAASTQILCESTRKTRSTEKSMKWIYRGKQRTHLSTTKPIMYIRPSPMPFAATSLGRNESGVSTSRRRRLSKACSKLRRA